MKLSSGIKFTLLFLLIIIGILMVWVLGKYVTGAVTFTGSISGVPNNIKLTYDESKITQISINGDIYSSEKSDIKVKALNEVDNKWLESDLKDDYIYYDEIKRLWVEPKLVIYYKNGYEDFIKDFSE